MGHMVNGKPCCGLVQCRATYHSVDVLTPTMSRIGPGFSTHNGRCPPDVDSVLYSIQVLQWNPYNADTLRNKRSVLIIGVSAFQRYGIYAHTLKQSSSMRNKC